MLEQPLAGRMKVRPTKPHFHNLVVGRLDRSCPIQTTIAYKIVLANPATLAVGKMERGRLCPMEKDEDDIPKIRLVEPGIPIGET